VQVDLTAQYSAAAGLREHLNRVVECARCTWSALSASHHLARIDELQRR